jgi:hypothetical protein
MEPLMTKTLTTALGLAIVAAKEMNLDCNTISKIIGDLDNLPAQAIYDSLENNVKGNVLILGDFRIGDQNGIDTYDIVLKFIEDNYSRARMKKFDNEGYFVAIGADRIPE